MPRGKLSNEEKLSIQTMLSSGWKIEKIVEETGRNKEVILKYLARLQDSINKIQGNAPKKDLVSKYGFVNRTESGQKKGTIVSTKVASEKADEGRKKSTPTVSRTARGAIHKIVPDNDE